MKARLTLLACCLRGLLWMDQGEAKSQLFTRVNMNPSLFESAGTNITGIATPLECLFHCLRADCSALVHDPALFNCSFGSVMANVFLPHATSGLQVWVEDSSLPPKVPHVLLFGWNKIQDLSLDSANSPSLDYPVWLPDTGNSAVFYPFKKGILACGGDALAATAAKDLCYHYILGDSEATVHSTLPGGTRRYSSYGTVGGTIPWILGGSTDDWSKKTTTLVLRDGKNWEDGPALPSGLSNACLIDLDDSKMTFLLAGQGSSSSFEYDWNNPGWVAVGDLPEPRYLMSCVRGNLVNGDEIILAVGGRDDKADIASSAYKYDKLNKVWSELVNLPITLAGGSLFNAVGRVIYCGGYYNTFYHSNQSAYELRQDLSGWDRVPDLEPCEGNGSHIIYNEE